jgi:glycolate oxidase FAD binding subunit
MSATQTAVRPETAEDIQAAVQTHAKLTPVGAGTKPTLTATHSHATRLEMTGLTGIVEYDPAEYTITARTGTTLQEITAALAANGQHLPFDPPWVQAGATLGGTIAAGVSGSGRHRYGSLRDFLIGVRFVDGLGRLVRGGGKVVKNAAGFDLPKLMVGSRGEFGILVEASLKVFPEPPAYGTLTHTVASHDEALALLARLARSSFDLYALDLYRPHDADAYEIAARIGGLAATIPARLEQLHTAVGGGECHTDAAAEAQRWDVRRELAWISTMSWLVKCAMTLQHAARLEAVIQQQQLPVDRLYTAAANSVWLAGTKDIHTLDALLQSIGLSGLVLRGEVDRPLIGLAPNSVFYQRIRNTLDPETRFRT